MNYRQIIESLLATMFSLLLFNGCSSVDVNRSVMIKDSSGPSCKALGPVNVDWIWIGNAKESMTQLRNQTFSKGGNTLVLKGQGDGVAYNCPNEKISK